MLTLLPLVTLIGAFGIAPGLASNNSSIDLSFAASSLDAFLELGRASPIYGSSLERRQGRQCSFPGGAFCDAQTCCRPGTNCCPGGCCETGYLCCPSGCCPTGSTCFRSMECCPQTATICPGQAACCPSGTQCCGRDCCPPSYICERNECIPQALKDKVVRFDRLEKNKEVLKNMCNGMRGKNTETLTYRGPDLKERAQTRIDAGCVDGYCAKLIRAGLIPANFNSCDEYPPASTMEGGNARSTLQRAINCIPSRENSHQGGKLGGFQSSLRKMGYTFQRGDKFVLSIDCDKVLGSLVPRNIPKPGLFITDAVGSLGPRELDKVSMQRNETVDDDVLLNEGDTDKYLVAPFGDLAPGLYTVNLQLVIGSTKAALIVDGDGYVYTTTESSVKSGESQQYSFTLEYWTPGLGLFLATTDASTRFTWSLDGTLGQFNTSVTSSSTGSVVDPSSVPLGSGSHDYNRPRFVLVPVAMTFILVIGIATVT